MIYYRTDNYDLYLGDCIDIMKTQVPIGTVDMIFADPPYRLSNGGITCHSGQMVCVNKGDWDKSSGFTQDHAFNKNWLEQCDKVLKPEGTIWISGTYHIIHSIAYVLLEMGYYIINEITWFKPNAAPNMGRRCFTASHETLLWAKKNKTAKHTFNYDLMREQNNGKQMRSVWHIPTTPKREKTYGHHPTQKPIALIERCIQSSTKEGDLVLDPFNGSGTTGVVSQKLRRKYIGIEIEETYLKLTVDRLNFK